MWYFGPPTLHGILSYICRFGFPLCSTLVELVQVDEVPDETAGGVLLPDSAKEKPIAGCVVRAGPGKDDKETGEFKKTRVAEGDRVLYFKWAGDNMETPSGKKYVVVHEQDILCKVKS